MKILDWVICDDIRFEDNGKKLLVGVYDQSVNFRYIPEPRPETLGLNLSSFIRILKVSEEEAPDTARVLFSVDEEIAHDIKLGLQPSHEGWKKLLTLVIKTDFQFKSSCTLSLKIELIRNDEVIHALEAPLNVSILIHEKDD